MFFFIYCIVQVSNKKVPKNTKYSSKSANALIKDRLSGILKCLLSSSKEP